MPLEVFVRSEALRERRNVVPMSATEDEMLCREACLRRGGVEGTLGGDSYWLGRRGWPSGGLDGKWSWGGVRVRAWAWAWTWGALLGPLFLPPKKEGRLLKMLPPVAVVEDVESCWSAMVSPVPTLGRRGVRTTERSGVLPNAAFAFAARREMRGPAPHAPVCDWLRWLRGLRGLRWRLLLLLWDQGDRWARRCEVFVSHRALAVWPRLRAG